MEQPKKKNGRSKSGCVYLMGNKRKPIILDWKYVFIGFRGKITDDIDFAGLVNLQASERLYLSFITDPPTVEGREHAEVRNWALKTKHQFARMFYYNGETVIEL